MNDKVPFELVQSLLSAAGTFGAALLGRLVWHARLAQKAERKFFSKHLLFELVIALGIGYAADGVMVYFGFEGKVALSGIIVLSYLGPGGIEYLITRYAKRFGPVK